MAPRFAYGEGREDAGSRPLVFPVLHLYTSSFNNRLAFSSRILGRASSLNGAAAKSRIQRSGVIAG